MKRLAPIVALLLVLSACHKESASASARPSEPQATVRLPAVPGRPASGYFELIIEGNPSALVSVTSPQAGRIEMHETMSAGTMTSMRPLARVPVRPGERLVFAPGGRHLMLYDLAVAVRPGGQIELDLQFEHGQERRLAARVEAAGGDASD